MEATASSSEAVESPQPGPSAPAPSSEKAVKTACSECRRQKVKCDANIEVPCSRCRRTSSLCQIVAPLKRVSGATKRKLLDSPQTSLPKRRLEMAPSTPSSQLDISSFSTPQIPDTPISLAANNATDLQTLAHSHPQSPASTGISQNHQAAMPAGTDESNQTVPRAALGLEELGMAAEIVRGDAPNASEEPSGKEYVKPSSRCLDGIWVDGKTIEEVFKLYFLHYSPLLPILDPEMHPDTYYTQLPFLFWCIVAVGSRRYPQDPTIFHSIGQRVIESASTIIIARPMTVTVVQALLILLTWGYWDRKSSKGSFPLSGFLIHFAMHMGLHNPLSGHDFLAMRTKLSDDERRRRGELWAHCVIVYQRSCLRIGFAPLNVPRPKLPIASSATSEHLEFESSLHDLMARASTALSENGLKFESVHQERGMCIILKIFEEQLTDLENRSTPLKDIDKLYLSICRLMIQAMYLHRPPENIEPTCQKRMYVTASLIIDLFNTLDKTTGLISYSTTYMSLGVILAATILLRFLKGSFAKYLDYDACKASFFSALTILKNSSVENNDGPARFALRLSHIWAGDQMFRMPDGSRNEELRVRSRLAMSVVFDTIWWSQDGEGCLHRPGCPHDRQINPGGNGDAVRDPGTQEQSTAAALSTGPSAFNFLDDEIPFDLGWALSDDVLFAPWQGGSGFPV